MSEYMFGVTKIKPSRRAARVIERVAAQHGCTWIEAELPGTGYQAWFAGPNLGHPFDRAMSDAVYADLEAAGIAYGEVE